MALISLTTLLASNPASARSYWHHGARRFRSHGASFCGGYYRGMGSHAQAYSRLGARIVVQPGDVVNDGVVIGRDPDPLIRAEMLRHYGVGGP